MLSVALVVLLVVLMYSVLYLYRRRGDALTDMVTGLPSRDYFERYLQNCTARIARQPDYGFGVLLLDIRGFGEIRKSIGRFAAEEILADFAERVFWAIRPTDVLARLEHDNFAVILEDVRTIADVARVAMRIQQSMREATTLASTEIDVQLNVGVTLGQHDRTRDARALIQEAEQALTRAIDADRPFAVFDPDLDAIAEHELQFERELGNAVTAEELRLAFQPWVDPRTNAVAGFAALLRWEHPTFGELAAREFIELAERTRATIALGRWELPRAVDAFARLAEVASPDVIFSVNVGASELEYGDLIAQLDECLVRHPEIRDRLRLEIPAGVLTKPLEGVRRMRESGVGFHVDIVDTSSLSLEAMVALGVRGIRTKYSPESARIIAAYAQVSDEIVLEFIETPDQVAFARTLPPKVKVQGYAIARPMPFDRAIDVAKRGLPALDQTQTD